MKFSRDPVLDGTQLRDFQRIWDYIIMHTAYDPFVAMDNYCISHCGMQMSRYNYAYTYQVPYRVLNEYCGELVKRTIDYDTGHTKWVSHVVMEFIWSGYTTDELVKHVKPTDIIKHFNPLHEIPIRAGCRKLSEGYNFEYTWSGMPEIWV